MMTSFSIIRIYYLHFKIMARRKRELDIEKFIQLPEGYSEEDLAEAFVGWLRTHNWKVSCVKTIEL